MYRPLLFKANHRMAWGTLIRKYMCAQCYSKCSGTVKYYVASSYSLAVLGWHYRVIDISWLYAKVAGT